jgi:hypothetical protein
MREAFFILLVIAAILALTAYRYRAHIGAIYRIWTVLRSARVGRRDEMAEPAEAVKGPLVNCAKCGIWVPESKAIKLGTRVFYCSAACVEKMSSAA